MDVDERLARMVGRDERVAVRRRLAEARADGDDEVRVADALLQLRVGAVSQLAGIDLARVADGILPAECGSYGDAVAEGEVREVVRRARAPVGAADDGDRRGGFLEQLEQ